MRRSRLQDLKQQFTRVAYRARGFKRFLTQGPDFDALEIERARDAARVVEL